MLIVIIYEDTSTLSSIYNSFLYLDKQILLKDL